jgi:hypothetical protein
MTQAHAYLDGLLSTGEREASAAWPGRVSCPKCGAPVSAAGAEQRQQGHAVVHQHPDGHSIRDRIRVFGGEQMRTCLTLATLAALSVGPAGADALSTCRVRLIGADGIERKSNVLREVESWVDVRDFGSVLVPSVDQADVLLELTRHTFSVTPDGRAEQQWWFVARRFSDRQPVRTHRFILMAHDLREGPQLVSERLPVIVTDFCEGRVPKGAVPPPVR